MNFEILKNKITYRLFPIPQDGFRFIGRYNLNPVWVKQVKKHGQSSNPLSKKILFFGMFRYWIFHGLLLGLVLASKGHHFGLSYLPYSDWFSAMQGRERQRQNRYIRHALKVFRKWVRPLPLLAWMNEPVDLPADLQEILKRVTVQDVQYTLQQEQIDTDSEIYRLRWQRNTEMAAAFWRLLRKYKPDIVVIPNATIMEFAVAFHVARYLEIQIVTYEFEEQRGKMWIAQDSQVMFQDTDYLWERAQLQPFTEDQRKKVMALFSARKNGELWQNFSRRWQNTATSSGERVRKMLNLDERPIALLAPNVFGDSVIFNRQIFTRGMTDWVQKTVAFFGDHPEMQLVVRVHPGEALLEADGVSMKAVVREKFPELPENVRVVAFDAPVNSYDLIEIASFGIVYTSTIGLEMAMSGLPVVVCGKTHYRGRGFTVDPQTWPEYYRQCLRLGAGSDRRSVAAETTDLAWKYAYHYFFEYPQSYPWHILFLEKDVKEWPLERVLAEGRQFDRTFGYFAGEPL